MGVLRAQVLIISIMRKLYLPLASVRACSAEPLWITGLIFQSIKK